MSAYDEWRAKTRRFKPGTARFAELELIKLAESVFIEKDVRIAAQAVLEDALRAEVAQLKAELDDRDSG